MASTNLHHVDPEDSPGVQSHAGTGVVRARPSDIHREERRFLIGTGDPQRDALAGHSVSFVRTYDVRTLYLDVPDGSWSISKSQIKYRLRQYNDEKSWWFEIKTNTQGMVDKHRRQVSPDQIDRLGLRPVVLVTYSREEYETGSDALRGYQEGDESRLAEWLRVTIDHNVTAWRVPRDVRPSQAMRSDGIPMATLSNLILETKTGLDKPPEWLPLPNEWDGSKSRFGVAALHGMPSMFAPAVAYKFKRAA